MITPRRRYWSMCDALNQQEMARMLQEEDDADLGADGTEGMDSDPREYDQEGDAAHQ